MHAALSGGQRRKGPCSRFGLWYEQPATCSIQPVGSYGIKRCCAEYMANPRRRIKMQNPKLLKQGYAIYTKELNTIQKRVPCLLLDSGRDGALTIRYHVAVQPEPPIIYQTHQVIKVRWGTKAIDYKMEVGHPRSDMSRVRQYKLQKQGAWKPMLPITVAFAFRSHLWPHGRHHMTTWWRWEKAKPGLWMAPYVCGSWKCTPDELYSSINWWPSAIRRNPSNTQSFRWYMWSQIVYEKKSHLKLEYT